MFTVYLIPHTAEAEEALLDRYGDFHTVTTGDSGVDIPLPRQVVIPADKEPHKIDMECTVRITKSGCPKEKTFPFMMCARSSCSKPGVRNIILTNGFGLIDKGYTGSLIAQFTNLKDEDATIERKTRLVQVVTPNLETPGFVFVLKRDEVDSRNVMLDSKDGRGKGGFGSTGEK